MGVGNRAATCASCGKRLNRKQWYYRNGKYFCKKRCWVTESEKAQQEAGKAEASNAAPKDAQPEAPKPEAPNEKAKAAPTTP